MTAVKLIENDHFFRTETSITSFMPTFITCFISTHDGLILAHKCYCPSTELGHSPHLTFHSLKEFGEDTDLLLSLLLLLLLLLDHYEAAFFK